MKGFAGFPEGPVRMTPVPAPFFTDLLPSIDHLGELKLTLYALWRFSQQEGMHRFLTLHDLREDDALLSGLTEPGRSGEQVLDDALGRAIARGTLIAVRSEDRNDGAVSGSRTILHPTRGRWNGRISSRSTNRMWECSRR
jgi:DNA replication protein